MRLTLTVLSYRKSSPADARTSSFDKFPVTIGRFHGSDYRLDDTSRYISSNHATITCEGNSLFVQDNSSNGVFLNKARTPIGRGKRATLENGDEMELGDYVLKVKMELDAPQARNWDVDDLFDDDEDASPTPVIPAARKPDPKPVATDPPDPLRTSVLGLFKPLPPTSDPLSGDWESSNTTSSIDAFLTKSGNRPGPDDGSKKRETDQRVQTDPDLKRPHDSQPDRHTNVDSLRKNPGASDSGSRLNDNPGRQSGSISSGIQRQPSPPTRHESKPPAETHMPLSLDALFSATALRPEDFSSQDEQEILAHTGRLMVQMVDAMMLLLHSRATVKNEMRSDVTIMARTNNNPLKFSCSATDALTLLLSNDSAGYMSSEAAISEAVDDLKQHQLAMVDGIKEAVAALILQFDPVTLARKLEKTGGITANIPVDREAKLWEMFCEKYDDIRVEAVNDFGDIFGTEFRKAYEKRIKETDREPDLQTASAGLDTKP